MIGKIKELMEAKELINKIDEGIKRNDKALKEFKNEINSAKNELKGMKKEFANFDKNSSDFLNEIKKTLAEINKSKEELDREVNDFRLVKSRMQEKIFTDVNTKLKEYMEELKTNYSNYKKMEFEFSNLKNMLNALSLEINKFLSVSRNIKEKDFEMEKTARELMKLDKEKLELMRKIETLQRIISAERRRR